ncbi:MAG: TetR/AcrR family transcriptional regulator, partial [Propionibacteriales bacterium]|nr:TetR/AcrR family transcriptional regulator [Propionibacteriales bacterium]
GTPRDRNRARTMAEITRIGREHLAADGAAALSLRAVARDLGVVSSAVYRYVRNRDDLLTLLVVDAYAELAGAVEVAVAPVSVSVEAYTERFRVIVRTVRTWALAEPARWALLYGSPVPGYAAPAEQTTEPGTRVMRRLVELIDRAATDGVVVAHPAPVLGRKLAADLRRIRREFGLGATDDALLARAVMVWSSLLGVISAEVFGAYGAVFTAPDQLFERQVALLIETLGLPQ